MTNIEKVKRILDAGHWVKVTYDNWLSITVTSYYDDIFTYIKNWYVDHNDLEFEDCTIEVTQRIPTPYKQGDKVLVLSNPSPGTEGGEAMVWKVMEVNSYHNGYYRVWTDDQSDWFYFPHHCLSPAFDEEPTLSWKEVTVTIDGKEYTAVMK